MPIDVGAQAPDFTLKDQNNQEVSLADTGVVWLLTPKAGRDGHVEPSEVSESAQTAGLQQTSTVNAGKDWTAARLVSPRGAKKK